MKKNLKLLISFVLVALSFSAQEKILAAEEKDGRAWNAQSYAQGSTQMQRKINEEILSEYLFPKGSSILNVGCGDGYFTHEFSKKTSEKVLGIDRSGSMIQFATENYINSNLAFKVQDARDIDYKEEFTDVVSLFCLQWVKEQENVL